MHNIFEVAVFDTIDKFSTLFYIGAPDIQIGDLVEIYLNKRKTRGLILEKISLSNNQNIKEYIKNNNFELKNINSVIKTSFITQDFIKNIKYISSLNGIKPTKCIESLLPKISLEVLQSLDHKNKNTNYNKNKIISNQIIYTPTILENIKLTENIKSYFKNNNLNIEILNFHSELPKNKRDQIIKILEDKTKIINNTIIISTPSLLPLSINNIDKIYWTNSSSKNYKNWNDIDTMSILSFLIEKYFKINQIFLGDESGIEIEKDNMFAYKNVFDEKLKLKTFYIKSEESQIDKNNNFKNDFIFSENIRQEIKKQIQDKKNIILYTTKNSDNPITVCTNCGNTVKCNICSKTMSLYIKEKTLKVSQDIFDKNKVAETITQERRFYLCSRCNIKKPIKSLIEENQKDMNIVNYNAFDICNHCGSFQITSMGISTKQIYNKITEADMMKYFNIKQKEDVILLDDNKISIKKRQALYDQFKMPSDSSKILIINESAINFLDQEDNIFIISIDGLFYIKNYEKDILILNTILNLKNKLKEKTSPIFLQTRQLNNSEIKNILQKIEQKTIFEIYKEELIEREKRSLPPFTYIISFVLIRQFEIIPEVLKDYKYYTIKNKINKDPFIVYKYIFLIPKDKWENDNTLRDFINNNFIEADLSIGNNNIF